MRTLILSFALALLTIAPISTANDRPNVVLILSDDQGWTDYGFMGHDVIETPHLDELARQSLVFPRGYVAVPLCRPSLASIVTGLYPHQHGVVANDPDAERTVATNRAIQEQFHQHPSFVRKLVDSGYQAFQSGKWWEGSWQRGGFTAGMTHGDPERGGRHGDAGLKIGRRGLEPVTEFIDQAIDDEQPFFVWYAPFLPHTPHNPPAELLAKYQTADRPENVAKYYAMCDWFDRTCGELLAHLDERGVRENTIVLYVCDNGWAPVDKSADNPPGWWPDYAPRSKGSPFELGIRTPIMVSWPGQVMPARSDDLASSLDLMPTVLAACDISPPANLPGINLLDPAAREGREAVFGGVWSTHNMNLGDPHSTLQYRWCVAGDWKLLVRHHGSETTRYRVLHNWEREPVRLYNVSQDPHERHNLAAERPEVVRRLARKIEEEMPVEE